MTEAEWLICKDPKVMLDLALRVTSERKLRLFGVACCRLAWENVTSDQLHLAVETSERFADGEVGTGQFRNVAAMAEGRAKLLREQQVLIETDPHAANWLCACAAEAIAAAVHPFPRLDLVIARLRDATRDDPTRDAAMAALLHDVILNPYRPVNFSPEWCTDTAVSLARTMYEAREFGAMPILADALQDAGCDNADILDHCRGPGPHVRGCWVVDLVLGKE